MESNSRICRLCLNFKSQIFLCLDNALEDILQIILPDVSVENNSRFFICHYCNTLVQEFFKFKSTCLEIEDTIHNYTCGGQVQVDLEKIIGLKEINEKKGKICRMCLEFIESNSFSELDDDNYLLVQMQRKCLPEMDLLLTKQPVICDKCESMLKECFNFFSRCMDNEEKICQYIKTSQAEIQDLNNILYSISSLPTNFSGINKTFTDTLSGKHMHSINHEITNKSSLDKVESQKLIEPNINAPQAKGSDEIFFISDADETEVETSSIPHRTPIAIETSLTSVEVSTKPKNRSRKKIQIELLGGESSDPDFNPGSESEDFSDFGEFRPKIKKKMPKPVNNSLFFSCKNCGCSFASAHELGSHVIQCRSLLVSNSANESSVVRDKNSSNDKGKILHKVRQGGKDKVKEADLLKGLQRIHDSIRELGRMKKHKKKKQKNKRNITNAKILQHTELSMKLKIYVETPEDTYSETSQRIEVEVGDSTQLVDQNNMANSLNHKEQGDAISSENTPGAESLVEAQKSGEQWVKLEDHSEEEIMSGNTNELQETVPQYTIGSNHRELVILKCDNCDFNTRSFQKIEQHVLMHIHRLREQGSLVCPHCPKKFEGILETYLHLKNKHNRCNYKLYYWCVNCAGIFANEKTINQHQFECPRRNYVCKLFKSNGTLFCMLCDYESDNEKEAKAHRNSCQFKEETVVGDTIEID